MIAALLLFSHNRMEDYRAGKQAEETIRAVESAMDARGGTGETEATAAPDAAAPDAAATATNAPGASPAAAQPGNTPGTQPENRDAVPAPPALDMPTVRTGSYDYIGYLDFPGYGLTMPVAATWSFPAL